MSDAASVGEVGGKRKLKIRQQYLAKMGEFVGSLQQGEDCLLLSLKTTRKGLHLSRMSEIEELFVRGVVVVLDDTETCFLSEMLSCIPSFTSQRTIKDGMKVENEDVVAVRVKYRFAAISKEILSPEAKFDTVTCEVKTFGWIISRKAPFVKVRRDENEKFQGIEKSENVSISAKTDFGEIRLYASCAYKQTLTSFLIKEKLGYELFFGNGAELSRLPPLMRRVDLFMSIISGVPIRKGRVVLRNKDDETSDSASVIETFSISEKARKPSADARLYKPDFLSDDTFQRLWNALHIMHEKNELVVWTLAHALFNARFVEDRFFDAAKVAEVLLTSNFKEFIDLVPHCKVLRDEIVANNGKEDPEDLSYGQKYRIVQAFIGENAAAKSPSGDFRPDCRVF